MNPVFCIENNYLRDYYKVVKAMDDLNLIAIELAITECAEDDYMENYITNVCSKILEDLQNLISYMMQYLKNLKADISVLAAKASMKMKLRTLKQMAKNGQSVSIPDFRRVEKVYNNACNVLPRELKKLLKTAYPINSTSDLEKFKDKKERFEQQLILFEDNMESILRDTKIYKAEDAYRIISGLLGENSIYFNSYFKAIKEFDHFKNEYKRALDEIQRKNDGLGKNSLMMHKSLLAKTSTSLSRMIKKATFAVCAVVI